MSDNKRTVTVRLIDALSIARMGALAAEDPEAKGRAAGLAVAIAIVREAEGGESMTITVPCDIGANTDEGA